MNIARYSNINEKHRATATAFAQALAVLAAEERLGRTGGGQNDVGMVCRFMQLLKRYGAPAKFFRQLYCALMRTVTHNNIFCAMGDQVARRQLRHLASANQIDSLIFE